MSADSYRVLLSGGIFMLLILLRLEARRFGAAEFDESGRSPRRFATQISWYVIGVALLAALYEIHPAPHDVLYLLAGHRNDVVFYGAIVAGLGLLLAAALAWLRYGYLRLPAPAAYPGAGLNSIATAFIDEVTFRGALLGALVAIGLPGGGAVLLMTVTYMIAARAAAPGRHYSVLVVAAFLGAAGGWATLASGGLGAAFIGHAVTSFGLFVFTGHAGQMPRGGRELEELVLRNEPPAGWIDARLVRGSAAGGESAAAYEEIGPSGFRSRADRWSAGRSTGLLAWIASAGLAATGRKPSGRSPVDRRAADRRPAKNPTDDGHAGHRTRGRWPANGPAPRGKTRRGSR
jgi:hypothetical protein